MPILELKHLGKTFRNADGSERHVLIDLDLAVNDDELLVLAGPSGGGKSTTLRLIAGLDEPDAGEVILDGRVLNRVRPDQRDVAMVFQGLALLPHLTAHDNLALGLRLRKTPAGEIECRVREVADLLGIGSCLGRRPKALSGGERQRVALGRALVRRPKLFLLDEPLSHLDAALRCELRSLIAEVRRRLGTAMIYVTHDQADAMILGHRIAVLHAGVIQQAGRPIEIYGHPANLFVAGFFGSPPMNRLSGVLVDEGGGLAWADRADRDSKSRQFHLPLPPEWTPSLRDLVGHDVIAGIRPEHIAVWPDAGASTPPKAVPASVRACEVLGSETVLSLAVGSVEVFAKVPSPLECAAGQRVSVLIDANRLHLFDPTTGRAVIGT